MLIAKVSSSSVSCQNDHNYGFLACKMAHILLSSPTKLLQHNVKTTKMAAAKATLLATSVLYGILIQPVYFARSELRQHFSVITNKAALGSILALRVLPQKQFILVSVNRSRISELSFCNYSNSDTTSTPREPLTPSHDFFLSGCYHITFETPE